MSVHNHSQGCQMSEVDWLVLNRDKCFEDKLLMSEVAPFPPSVLMANVSGLNAERDFASQGCDIFQALARVSDIPLTDYEKILDFGCGCGKLTRLFKGHPHEVYGCDFDYRYVKWMQKNLPYMHVALADVHPPLPYAQNSFDAIISVYLFTHLNELSQDEFLAELQRISSSGGRLFLTVHGETALRRAKNNPITRAFLEVDNSLFIKAEKQFYVNRHAFISRNDHLTLNAFNYWSDL